MIARIIHPPAHSSVNLFKVRLGIQRVLELGVAQTETCANGAEIDGGIRFLVAIVCDIPPSSEKAWQHQQQNCAA